MSGFSVWLLLGCSQKTDEVNPGQLTLPGSIYFTEQGENKLVSVQPVAAPATIKDVDVPKWYNLRGYGFDVSRDGSEILYMVDDENAFSRNNKVWIVDKTSLKTVVEFYVHTDYSWNGVPKLSFDKSKIAICAGHNSDVDKGVTIYDRKGNELSFFRTSGDINPHGIDWLPDGRLLFTNDNSIYVTDVSLKKASALVSLKVKLGRISASPDGKKVAFEAGGHIFSVNSNGSQVQAVTYSEDKSGIVAEQSPVWSPDGQYIAFAVVSLAYRDGQGDSVHSLAIVKDTGTPHVITVQAVRLETGTGSVGFDDLSGKGVLFMSKQKDGRTVNVNIGVAPVWR